MVSTHLKNMLVKFHHFPKYVGVKIQNIWNQHLDQEKKVVAILPLEKEHLGRLFLLIESLLPSDAEDSGVSKFAPHFL